MIRVLGVNDIAKKREFFRNFIDQCITRNIFPELDASDKDNRIQALMNYSMYCNTYVAESDSSCAFAIAYVEELNPHIEGKVLMLSATIAYGTNSVLPKLIRSLVRFAKELDCSSIAISHRIAPFTYRCKYVKLKR